MQPDLNIEKIRKDFPIFKNNPELIYLDNAATTQKPKIVINNLLLIMKIIIQMYIEVFIK